MKTLAAGFLGIFLMVIFIVLVMVWLHLIFWYPLITAISTLAAIGFLFGATLLKDKL